MTTTTTTVSSSNSSTNTPDQSCSQTIAVVLNSEIESVKPDISMWIILWQQDRIFVYLVSNALLKCCYECWTVTFTACFPDTPRASLLAEYANAAHFLMLFSVLRAAGWPLTSWTICFWLQMCTTTTAEGKPVTVCGFVLVLTGRALWEGDLNG